MGLARGREQTISLLESPANLLSLRGIEGLRKGVSWEVNCKNDIS